MILNTKIDNSQSIGLKSFFPPLKYNTKLQRGNNQKKSDKKSIVTTIFLIKRRSLNSDIWICNSCNWTGDRWFMEKHPCRQNVKNNFAKIAQQFQEYF